MKSLVSILVLSSFLGGCSSLITRGDLRRCQEKCQKSEQVMDKVKVKDGQKDCLCKDSCQEKKN